MAELSLLSWWFGIERTKADDTSLYAHADIKSTKIWTSETHNSTIHIHSAPYLILHDIYYMYMHVHWIKAELSHLLSLFASSFCLLSGWIYSSNGYCIIGVIWEGYWVLSPSLLSFLSPLRTREDQTVPGRICVTEQESTLQTISTVNSSERERDTERDRERDRERERGILL